MFFSGILKVSPSIVDFHTDLVGLLSGAITDVSGLTANFTSPVIINTVPAGWGMHDTAAGSLVSGVTPKVIQSAWSDDPTRSKHCYISAISTTQLAFQGWDTWNPTTHVGTFPTTTPLAASTWATLTMVAGHQVVVSVTPTHWLIIVSVPGSQFQQQLGILEFTRDDPWRTVANGYPAWLQFGANYSSPTFANTNIVVPYVFAVELGADVAPFLGSTTSSTSPPGMAFIPDGGNAAAAAINVGGGCLGGSNTGSSLLAANQGASPAKTSIKYAFPIGYRLTNGTNLTTTSAFLGGSISTKCPHLYFTHNNLNTPGEEFLVGSDTYFVTAANNGGRLIIKKA